MAGDWIPMRIDLADDPAVIAIAAATGLDEDTVVGKLHRLWSWANKHLENGYARNVTDSWIDRHTGAPGFAAAMLDAGWLRTRSGGVEFPSFDRWNSQGAKNRVLTAQRMRRKRDAERDDGGVTKSSPEKRREEKRKGEEQETPPNPPLAGGDSSQTPPRQRPKKPPQHPELIPIPAALDSPAFRQIWTDWLADRKARGKPVTELAARQQLSDLSALTPENAIECVKSSIRNGWAGLFTDKYRSANQSPQPTASRSDFWERKKAEATNGGSS